MNKKMKILSAERPCGDPDYLLGIFESEEMAEHYASIHLFSEQTYHIDEVSYLPELRTLADGKYAYNAIVSQKGVVIIQQVLSPGDYHGFQMSNLPNGTMALIIAASHAEDLRERCRAIWADRNLDK